MMKFISRLLIIIVVPLSISSCGSEPYCGEVDSAYSSHFRCYVNDRATNKSLITNFGSPYDNSFSSLVNEKGEDVLSNGPILSNGAIVIPLAIYPEDSIEVPIKKTYYLHLVDGNKVEKDIDTLQFSFELYNSDNCHGIDFSNFKCYFNDNLYITEFPWDTYAIYFYK